MTRSMTKSIEYLVIVAGAECSTQGCSIHGNDKISMVFFQCTVSKYILIENAEKKFAGRKI